MDQKFTELRRNAQATKEAAANAENALQQAVRACKHTFGKHKYDPIVTPGGYDPGDPEGTMGVDRRLPTSWDRSEKPRWSRECQTCGKVEYTEKTSSEPSVQVPKFG